MKIAIIPSEFFPMLPVKGGALQTLLQQFCDWNERVKKHKITVFSAYNNNIAAYCALYGSLGFEMEDYAGLSPRCTIFSASDDFSGDYLISPMVDKSKTNIIGGKVLIKKYSQIGACSTILPAVIINEGVAVGAMSLVNKSLDGWGFYMGIPVRRIKERSKGLLKFILK